LLGKLLSLRASAALTFQLLLHNRFNERLLDLFIEQLALDPTWVKKQPCYDELRAYGAIAA
jgi:hypothetical protein